MNLYFCLNKLLILCVMFLSDADQTKTSSIHDDFYIAGVLEYNYIESETSFSESTKLNVKEYIKFVELAKTKGVDILVFPEATLNYDFVATRENSRENLIQEAAEIPDPALQIAPWEHSSNLSYLLVELSKAAKKNQIYVLVNLVEKVHCSANVEACKSPLNVHNDGYSLYNVNIVFDRLGRIISKYRKQNLFIEPRVDELLDQPLPIFETDFGVKFGHFICFDILFKYPARALVQQANVTNILYPTYWYNMLPFFVAETMHQGWAFSNNVNFLVSGANRPDRGNSGTGIYFGRKRMQVAATTAEPTRKLYTAKVPKNIRSDINFDEPVIREEVPPSDRINFFVTGRWMESNPKIYPILPGPQTICVKDNKLCCTVDITSKDLSVPPESHYYQYVLVVDYTNKLYIEKRNVSEISCAIISCAEDTLESCDQKIYETSITPAKKFNHIKITAKVRSDSFNDIMMMPVTTTAGFLPFAIENYKWTTTDTYKEGSFKYQVYTIESSGYIPDFLTYGIYGRDFSLDAGMIKDLENFYERFDCVNNFCKPKTKL